MSETLGTRITYKGRTYLDGSITGNEFATSMTGTIDNETRVLTLQLKNGENDLGEPIEITIPTQELTSTDYATDINFSLDTSTGVLSVQLTNEDGDTIGTEKTVTLELSGGSITGASYTTATKTITLTQDEGEPIDIALSNLQELIDPNNKLSSSLVDDSNSNNKFIWVGTAAEYATAASTIPSGTPVIITDDTGIDAVPTENSTNLMTSGGIYNAISNIESTLGDINTALEGML